MNIQEQIDLLNKLRIEADIDIGKIADRVSAMESSLTALEQGKPAEEEANNLYETLHDYAMKDRTEGVRYGLRMALDVVSKYPDKAVSIIKGLLVDFEGDTQPKPKREWRVIGDDMNEIVWWWDDDNKTSKNVPLGLLDRGDLWMPYHDGDEPPAPPEVE